MIGPVSLVSLSISIVLPAKAALKILSTCPVRQHMKGEGGDKHASFTITQFIYDIIPLGGGGVSWDASFY